MKKIRYAVVGAGHIAQGAVLPAFKNASKNSELVAIVSGDPQKHRFLSEKYGVEAFAYESYDAMLQSGGVDAAYIALPNHMHCEFTVRAAQAGVHILCEKPMAVTETECRRMIDAAQEHGVKLMVAYRLHFEETNVQAVKIAQSGRLGQLRFFNSAFSMQVRSGDIRLEAELGGGTLYDIGIYCISAARHIFDSDPYEVFAYQGSNQHDERFKEVAEMTSALLRFPDQRLATFTVSFGATDLSSYQIAGTEGDLRVDPAYGYVGDLVHHLTREGKTETKVFKQRDQFAPELLYFSDCILNDEHPEPSGHEGLADVRIIEALRRSAATGKAVPIQPVCAETQSREAPIITKPAIKKPQTVHVTSPRVTAR